MSFISKDISCASAALAAVVLAGPAAAQSMSLRDHLFGAPSDERAFSTPSVARFVPDDGEPFVLDRSAGRPVFMKFDTSPEIWALVPTPGPRGDVIYKNDMGEPVLRATRLGGLTLFTQDRPEGVAVAFGGEGPLLRPPPVISANGLLQSFAQASERAARAARHPVTFEAEGVPLAVAGLFADAATVTAQAFAEIAARGDRARGALSRYSKVRFELGRNPVATATDGMLKVTIASDRGLAGRPSSHRIAAALSRR
jgi:hypothetical protein